MTTAADFFGVDDAPPAELIAQADDQAAKADLLADLKGVFRRDWDNHPRSQQKRLGPSEVGHPCPRKLAAGLLQLERINPEGDPLPAWLGTAGHTKLEGAVIADNERIIAEHMADSSKRCTFRDGQPVGRWYTERRVTIREDLSGTCDLYDTWSKTVIDFKFPGASRAKHYDKHGPSPEYRKQAHLYGRGYRNEGFDVERVGIWFIPRASFLSKSFVWSEPYDDTVADEILQKLDSIMVLLADLDIENHLELLSVLPKVAHECDYCPFFTPRADPLMRPHACQGADK